MNTDDQKLFDAFDRRRDEAAFRDLYASHTPMLFALAIRLSGSRADAENLTQEAWVRAVERHDRYDRRAKYSTWLVGILINCSRESARRRARAPLPLDEKHTHALDESVALFPVSVRVPADTLDVERALSNLSDGYREVVLLHDLHGYTHREIAVMLDIQEGTSKSQLTRGRARLREWLTNTHASGADGDKRGTS